MAWVVGGGSGHVGARDARFEQQGFVEVLGRESLECGEGYGLGGAVSDGAA